MGLQDLISTPFGQSMSSRRRTVSPRSARFRSAARRIGEFTPEGRRLKLQGELMRMDEPNVATPESNSLMQQGEQLKAAYASGAFEGAKDLAPLKRQWFSDVNAANLSAQDKEGIRRMFVEDFDKAGTAADAEQKRVLDLKNQELAIKSTEQNLQAGKQLGELRAVGLDKAKRDFNQETEALNQRDEVQGALQKFNTDMQKIDTDFTAGTLDVAQRDRDRKKAIADLSIIGSKFMLDDNQVGAVNAALQQAGSEIRYERSRAARKEDREFSREVSTQNFINSTAASIGHVPDFAKSQQDQLKDALNAVKTFRKDQASLASNVKITEDINSIINELKSSIPLESDDVPEEKTAAQVKLTSLLSGLETYSSVLPPSAKSEIDKEVTALKTKINNKEWVKVDPSTKKEVVVKQQYLLLADEIRNLTARLIFLNTTSGVKEKGQTNSVNTSDLDNLQGKTPKK
tara:strand:- start:27314 stop:28690 length:1377 start_codon:yes stop_codon:yes gene_type:complete